MVFDVLYSLRICFGLNKSLDDYVMLCLDVLKLLWYLFIVGIMSGYFYYCKVISLPL